MTENESPRPTPREFEYWELTYRDLVITPEWFGLGAEGRVQKLLERIEEKLAEADSPPQQGALFNSSREGNLETVQRMIAHFEEKGRA